MQLTEQKNSFDYLLGFHCTPTLAGIKCANLFSVHHLVSEDVHTELIQWNFHFNPRGIYLKRLCFCEKKDLILVYKRELLEKAIHAPGSQELLQEAGYPLADGLEGALEYLAHRLQTADGFPHEIGIFLGYPIEDVIGFTQHAGQNYKLCGYWKVYGDEHAATALFERYTRCRNNVCNRLGNGLSIHQIFKSA